jgi:hypothetical protein
MAERNDESLSGKFQDEYLAMEWFRNRPENQSLDMV